MKFLTKANLRALPPIYSQDGRGMQAIAHVKFFAPWSHWTWYASEYDPETETFYGLVRGHENELGYFSRAEMAAVRGPGGLRIERDLHFRPATLAECLEKSP